LQHTENTTLTVQLQALQAKYDDHVRHADLNVSTLQGELADLQAQYEMKVAQLGQQIGYKIEQLTQSQQEAENYKAQFEKRD
jgi:hypothetical protein